MTVSIKEFGKNASASVIGTVIAADDAIANTTTETKLEDYTIPKNTLKAGDVLHFHASGQLTVTSTPTLTIALYIGSTAVITLGALTVTGASASAIVIDGYITIRTVGATGTAVCDISVHANTEAIIFGCAADTTADSINTTGDLACTLSFDWSAASTSNTITIAQFLLEKC